MFPSRFLGRGVFPCLSLLKHDSTTNLSVILTKGVAGKITPGATVSSVSMREKRFWFLFVWWVTQPHTAWGPGGQVGMEQPCAPWAGAARSLLSSVSRSTASTLRDVVICLFSALHLDTALGFGQALVSSPTSTQWEKTPMNCSELTCEKMGELGMFSLEKRWVQGDFTEVPPTPYLGGWQLKTDISQCCMVGGKGKLQHEVFRLDLERLFLWEPSDSEAGCLDRLCSLHPSLLSVKSLKSSLCFVFSPAEHCLWLHSLRNP